MTRRRVAYLADAPLPSQAANAVQVLKMVAALGALGHDVTLFAPWHGGRVRGPADLTRVRRDFALDGEFRLRYLPYAELRGRFGASYYYVAAAASALARADLAYTRNPRIAALAARLGRKVILESHMPVSQSARGSRAVRHVAASARLFRWVFISERLRALYREGVALPEDRCVVEHDAVDLDRFTPVLPVRDARARLGLDAERPLVVYCGHLYPGRGGDELVAVAAALPHVDVLMVGGHAEDVARIRALAAARGAANVRLVGHRPVGELPAYLFAADVLVMPHTRRSVASDRRTAISDYASPMKLFEYMAAERPIVATEFPSVTEVLTHDVNGLLVEPDRVEALRDAIAALVADPARAARLGARARADVSTRTWERRAARILDGA